MFYVIKFLSNTCITEDAVRKSKIKFFFEKTYVQTEAVDTICSPLNTET